MKPSVSRTGFLFRCISKTRWVIIFLLFILVRNGTAQDLTSDLAFKPAGAKKLYDSAGVNLVRDTTYTEQEKKQLKKRLLERVDETLFNLEDDSTGLANDYSYIWPPRFLKDFTHELKELRKYLAGEARAEACPPFRYVPSPCSIEERLQQPVVTIKKKPGNGYIEFDVIKKDLLNAFLLESYNFSLQNDNYLWKKEIDISYLKEWRVIEQRYENLRQIYREARAIKNDIFSYNRDIIDSLRQKAAANHLPENGIVQKIRFSRFIRQWLWYTGGVININPLLVTSKPGRYPYSEKNSFFTPEKQYLQDSLNKMPVLDRFRQSAHIYNRIQLPVTSGTKKSTAPLFMEYDALQNYKSKSADDVYLVNGQSLKIAVYNIPANTTVTAQYKEGKLVYESSAISRLNSVTEPLSVVTNLGFAQKSAFARVTGMLNATTLNRIQTREVKETQNAVSPLYQTPEDKQFFLRNYETSDPFTPYSLSYRNYRVTIGDQVIPLTGSDLEEDKRRILWGALRDSTRDTAIVFLDKAIEAFIKRNKSYFLDYTTEAGLVRTAEKLREGFVNYLKQELVPNLIDVDTLLAQTKSRIDRITPFVRIYNRSLPQGNLAATTDTACRHYTQFFDPELPEAPGLFKYALLEQSGKAAPKEVTRKELKVIKTLKMDFSVGLGMNFCPYTISRSDGTALPVTENGNQVQFVAGLHWYFLGRLNKLNDRFLGKPEERFSLYAGLSIQNALDNYYAGLSYDVWPGIRLIAALHYYRNQSFRIVNNKVAEMAYGIEFAGPFLSVNIEPEALGKAIGLFK